MRVLQSIINVTCVILSLNAQLEENVDIPEFKSKFENDGLPPEHEWFDEEEEAKKNHDYLIEFKKK